MTGPDVDIHAGRAAAYVHIPFCSAVCPYCDFAVVAGADDRIERYVAVVITEIELAGPGALWTRCTSEGEHRVMSHRGSSVDPEALARSTRCGSRRRGRPWRPTPRISAGRGQSNWSSSASTGSRSEPRASMTGSWPVSAGGTDPRTSRNRSAMPVERRVRERLVDLIFGTPDETDGLLGEIRFGGRCASAGPCLLLRADGGARHPLIAR